MEDREPVRSVNVCRRAFRTVDCQDAVVLVALVLDCWLSSDSVGVLDVKRMGQMPLI